MEKWSFNLPLLNHLPKVLDISGSEIARRCKINQRVMSRYILGHSEMSIKVLLQICNALRMPIYFFVSENCRYDIPNREAATVPLDKWKPVVWNLDNVNKVFGDSKGKIYWKDVAVAMGSSPQKPHERFSLRRRFKVGDFFKACNAFDLSPFLFLDDPNRPTSKAKPRKAEKKKPTPPPSYDELYNKVDGLERTVTAMQKQLDDLMQKHEALARRVQVNIQNVSNSNIQNVSNSHITGVGIDDHMDIAAETNPGSH